MIINKHLKDPVLLRSVLLAHFGQFLSDKQYISLKWRICMGYKLDLDNPRTFSEKLQWLKLYDHNPEYTKMVDKVTAKEYVAGILGDEFIIPTIGVWERAEDIEWDKLPDRFVLKCNHDSGGLIICKDKSKLDKVKAVKKLNKCLGSDYYKAGREWPYKNVPRKILAEEFIDSEPDSNDLPDYKFFCFNGEPKYCQVITGRATKMCIDFFDKEWIHQPFHEPRDYPFAEIEPKRPKYLDKMWNAATKLSEGKPFSRIDFYEVGEKVLFGEITFFPTSGCGGFDPEEWDYKIGSWLDLNGVKL